METHTMQTPHSSSVNLVLSLQLRDSEKVKINYVQLLIPGKKI